MRPSDDPTVPAVPPVGNDWLTLEELCKLLRVPKWWVYERTRTRRIPHYKLGKYLRFRREELEQWIVTHQRSTGSS